MIRTCFSTIGCPDWSFSDMIRLGQQAGFDGVEIRLVERETDLLAVPDLGAAALPERRRELAEAGFAVCGLASSVSFDSTDAAERERQLDVGRAYLDLAAELDARFVRVFGDTIAEGVSREATIEQVSEGLDRLGEYAATLGREVIIETHGDFSRSELVADTMARVESPAVGILWDTHHPWRFHDEPLATTYARFADRVRHTHWKDSVTRPAAGDTSGTHQAAEQAHALMTGHQHADYVLFGGGEFPVFECLGLLQRGGYDGWYSYEWEKMWHPELEPPELALPLFSDKIRHLHALLPGR
jgi:sugar phosphate isomerase/epimerase